MVPEDTWQRTKGALIVALTSSFVLASRSVSFLGIMVFRVCVRQKNGFVDPRERSKEGYFGLIWRQIGPSGPLSEPIWPQISFLDSQTRGFPSQVHHI